jgi:putative ABC transport system permease protein
VGRVSDGERFSCYLPVHGPARPGPDHSLDQTRTTGLVTLPGAFVGALFGGASPLQAARFQLVVLVGLLVAESVAAVVLLRPLADVPALPPTTAPT